MCGGGNPLSGARKALDNINNWHPLSGIIDAPLIDPYLQGDVTAAGSVRPGSYVDKKNQNLGVSDISDTATFFAQGIAGGLTGGALGGEEAGGFGSDLEAAGTSAGGAGAAGGTSGLGAGAPAAGTDSTFVGDIPTDPNAGSASMPAATAESPQQLQAQGLQQTAPGVYEQAPSPSVLNALGVQQTPTANQPGQPAPGQTQGTQTATGQPTQPTTQGQPPQAPGQPSSSGAPGGTTGNSTVDKILTAMKNNPLGTASTALLAANALSAKKPNGQAQQASQQQQEISAQAKQTADQLLQQYRSGTLSATQQAQLDQLTQSTKNQLTQYFASIGQSDSTAARQAIAQVDQQALGMKQQMLDNALAQGMSALGVASGPLQSVINYNTGQDQQLRNAFGNFATSVGTIFGRGSGTTQQPQQAPAAPSQTQTQPTQVVQSDPNLGP